MNNMPLKAGISIAFNGNCEEAFSFYSTHLGGEIGLILKYKDAPLSEPCAPELLDKVVHAGIRIADLKLAGGDVPSEVYGVSTSLYLLLGMPSATAVDQAFKALSAQGTVIMAPQKTFWSPRYAIVEDQFGVRWKLNC